jgi:hypothetical protein
LKVTYGTVVLVNRRWEIRCEPHVRIRLKRVFGRVDKGQFDVITLVDSPETCRELLWFCERYPLEIDPLSYMEAEAARHKADEQQLFDLVHGHVPPAEFDLALPLRPYQRIATDLALKTGGLLLGDDVGLGKTACSIGMFTDPRTLPALVVTHTHLQRQWEREIHRFAPALSTHIVKVRTPYELESVDVLITTYHKLADWADLLAEYIRCVVYDEVQELRRGTKSFKGLAARHISKHAAFRLGLSATPIYNYGGEMYQVMESVRPGALGDWREFCNDWTGYDGESIDDPKAFGTYLRDAGLMLRRTREDVSRELPSLTKSTKWMDADLDTLDAMASSADELALAILRGHEKQTDRFAHEREFSMLLRQATGIAKAPMVAEFVRMLIESGEQVVLYGWHRAVYEIWLDRLAEYSPAMYTGSESPAKKDAEFQRFIAKEARVLLISLRSGAGLDGLQHHCRTVVFGELDWTPGVHTQCEGRVHRDGQLDEVTAYYLVATGGSDPFVAEVLGLKRAQLAGINDPAGAVIPHADATGVKIRDLARAYLEQRRGEKEPPAALAGDPAKDPAPAEPERDQMEMF